MKALLKTAFVLLSFLAVISCKNNTPNETNDAKVDSPSENATTESQGQAFLKDDEATPNVQSEAHV